MRLNTELVTFALVLLTSIVLAVPDYSGLGHQSHCRRIGCCDGRKDECASPILGTLCYCDNFCRDSRLRSEDCCPDYWSHCHGIINTEPEPNIEPCRLGRNIILPGKTIKDNCNLCKCELLNMTKTDLMCENNACLVEPEIISAVNSQQHKIGWQATNYTEFWGRKLSEGLTLRLGTLQPNKSVMRMEPIRRSYDPYRLPKTYEVDSRYLTGIQDQGWCGASWAVSTVAVASDRFALMSHGDEKVTLSAQHLLSCNNRGQQSCNGGYLDRAWLFLRKFGIVDEACYPYVGRQERCRIPKRGSLLTAHCGRQPGGTKRKEMYRVAPAYRLGNETDIMYEIEMNGPVQATMKVYQDFFSYRGGVYRPTMLSTLARSAYHSVRIVGWGEDASSYPPIKYWKVANSWGRDWGEDGYFRIQRGTNECEIETFVVTAWAQPAMNDNEVLSRRG